MTGQERKALVAIGGHLMKIQDIAKELDERWGGPIATQAALLDVQAHEALRLARAALAAYHDEQRLVSDWWVVGDDRAVKQAFRDIRAQLGSGSAGMYELDHQWVKLFGTSADAPWKTNLTDLWNKAGASGA